MHIDEFLEIYTPIELERQESKLMEGGQGLLSLSRFTASGSPAKGMSPVRASRIIAGVIDSFNPSSPRRSLATKK